MPEPAKQDRNGENMKICRPAWKADAIGWVVFSNPEMVAFDGGLKDG